MSDKRGARSIALLRRTHPRSMAYFRYDDDSLWRTSHAPRHPAPAACQRRLHQLRADHRSNRCPFGRGTRRCSRGRLRSARAIRQAGDHRNDPRHQLPYRGRARGGKPADRSQRLHGRDLPAPARRAAAPIARDDLAQPQGRSRPAGGDVRSQFRSVGRGRRTAALLGYAAHARRSRLLSRRPDPRGIRRLSGSQSRSARGPNQSLYGGRAARRWLRRGALFASLSRMAGSSGAPARTGCRTHIQPEPQAVPFAACEKLPERRLFRKRDGVDGSAGYADRDRDRPLRGLHRPTLRDQDCVRELRHPAQSRGKCGAGKVQELPAHDGGEPPDPRRAQELPARFRKPDRGGRPGAWRRRQCTGYADHCLQPAQ